MEYITSQCSFMPLCFCVAKYGYFEVLAKKKPSIRIYRRKLPLAFSQGPLCESIQSVTGQTITGLLVTLKQKIILFKIYIYIVKSLVGDNVGSLFD